jgi:hypothetical protein
MNTTPTITPDTAETIPCVVTGTVGSYHCETHHCASGRLCCHVGDRLRVTQTLREYHDSWERRVQAVLVR